MLKIVENVIGMARTDLRFAEVVTPLSSKIKNALDCLPIIKLSKWVKKPIQYETLGRNARAGLLRIAGQSDLNGAQEVDLKISEPIRVKPLSLMTR